MRNRPHSPHWHAVSLCSFAACQKGSVSGLVVMRICSPGSTRAGRSEEHTSELQSLMRISYAVFCLKKKKNIATRKHKRTTKVHIYGEMQTTKGETGGIVLVGTHNY